jgi:RNA polymerase sigma-70 factor (ECF subfamily)
MTGGGPAPPDEVRRALADAMARERLRIVAALIRVFGDWDLAEDAVADAGERALRRWPLDGIPANPAAWLTTTARRRAIDVVRRLDVEGAKLAEVAMQDRRELDKGGVPAVADDRLRLMFTCCHPALPLDARVALTLKVVSGLSTAAVGRAFLVSEPTIGQRLLRAKRKIANAAIPYRVPSVEMLPERLDGVLAVVYLVFTEGWAAGADSALAEEAIRLGRLLVELLPESGEARDLLALMLLQHSRRDARTVDGNLVTLEHQDRSCWDGDAIAEALTLLRAPNPARGSYRIQAELAAVHATARRAELTDWPAIVALYDELLRLHPSPVVSLNRAIAIGLTDGPRAGLAALDELASDSRLAGYHPLPAARGELLARTGRRDEAAAELARAALLAPTEQERIQLHRRRAELS